MLNMNALIRLTAGFIALLALIGCSSHDEIYFAERVGGPFGPWQIMVMDADGGNPRQLTSTSDFDNDKPEVSPDGTMIAFVSERDFPPPPDGVVQNPMLRMIYIMNSDGSNQRRVTSNSTDHCSEDTPRFSPDGQWIVFSMSCDNISPGSTGRLYRVRVDGTAQEALLPNHPDLATNGNYTIPAFAADGQVLFVGEIASVSSSDIFSMPLDGDPVLRLTRNADSIRDIASRNRLSIFGGEVYFVSVDYHHNDQTTAFESVVLDGGQPQQQQFEIPGLTSPQSLVGVARDFDLSLTGNHLVCVSYDNLTTNPPTQAIVVSAPDGSGRIKIRTGGFYSHPTWRYEPCANK